MILRNGREVPRKAWGMAVPVDPGPHLIEASAPDGLRFRQQVEVEPNGDDVAVVVILKPVAPPPRAPLLRPTTRSTALPPELMVSRNDGYEYLQPLGWVVTGSGLLATAIGFGIYSAGESKVSASEASCNGDLAGCDDTEAMDQAKEGNSLMRTGLPLGIAGLTGLVAGVVTLVAYGHASAGEDGADVGFAVGPNGAGASLSLSF